MKLQLGIIGFGQFGRFAAKQLEAYAAISAFDAYRHEMSSPASLAKACASDIVLFAVPAQNLEEACAMAAPHLRDDTRVADVSSVKIRPVKILQERFGGREILGTHPIFGPQSGKNGISGLPIVLSNVSWTSEHYAELKDFLSGTLGLRVIERTPDQHDREMARVQGLAHFIGRALSNLGIKDYETGTASYHQLVELRNLLQDDSWELFKTIQNENPYAAEVRADFLRELESLEQSLGSR